MRAAVPKCGVPDRRARFSERGERISSRFSGHVVGHDVDVPANRYRNAPLGARRNGCPHGRHVSDTSDCRSRLLRLGGSPPFHAHHRCPARVRCDALSCLGRDRRRMHPSRRRGRRVIRATPGLELTWPPTIPDRRTAMARRRLRDRCRTRIARRIRFRDGARGHSGRGGPPAECRRLVLLSTFMLRPPARGVDAQVSRRPRESRSRIARQRAAHSRVGAVRFPKYSERARPRFPLRPRR